MQAEEAWQTAEHTATTSHEHAIRSYSDVKEQKEMVKQRVFLAAGMASQACLVDRQAAKHRFTPDIDINLPGYAADLATRWVVCCCGYVLEPR